MGRRSEAEELVRQGMEMVLQGVRLGGKVDLDSKVMLTVNETAQLLGIHGNTVRRLSKKGLLSAYRIGSRGDRRYRREDIERFLEQSKQ